MLKYYSIINQLSEKDKIRLLTDITCLANKEFKVIGIPEIKIADASNYCADLYPSAITLANSWDTSLIGSVADEVYKTMLEDDIGLISVPSPKIKIDPYVPALSEDPYLASAVSREYLKSATNLSVPTAINAGELTQNEAEWLDNPPDERFIREFLFKPYCDAAKDLGCTAIFAQSSNSKNSANARLSSKPYTSAISKNATVICRRVSAEDTVLHIANGGLCFEGSAPELESALMRYNQTKKAIEHGQSTVEDLNTELSLGKAISPQTIDEATDKLIDFAFSVKRKPQLLEESNSLDLSLTACERSTVLLKNESAILPIKKLSKVCILGDIACETHFLNSLSGELNTRGYQFIGFSRGYDIRTDRSEELIGDALDLASQADIVLLFLGLGARGENIATRSKKIDIPANQQELLDSLAEFRDKIVAILPPDHTPDVGLPDNCSAIIFAPIKPVKAAKSLANILSGQASPSGKLASTVYTDTESQYVNYKTRRMRDGIKVGSFIGYRYYDKAGDAKEFPFGHGLSYSHFTYSRLSVHAGKVSFTVKNDGKVPASEIAQLYIGMEDPEILLPLKELRGFARIDLRPGEKKTVELPLNVLQVYDEKTSSFVEPAASYNVYVGSSSADIRLTQTIRAGDAKIESDGKRTVDYIHTESNILTDNFKLEAKVRTMKKPVFNFITGTISIFLGLALKLYCLSLGNDSLFFDFFAIALGFLGLILFISEAARRNKIHQTQREQIDKATEKNFESAEKITKYDAEAMFVKEFDSETNENTHVTEHRNDDVSSEYIAYIDKSQNFASAVTEFEIFAASRGCKFAPAVIKKIFAALASSRLIVTTGINDKDFNTFMTVLSNYFESKAFIDRVDSSYISTENLLFKRDSSGAKVRTQALSAIETARSTSHNIHFAGLTNVTASELPNYFSAYINYFKNPYGHHYVTVSNDKNAEASYYIPQNLWFVLNIAETESPASLPDFITEIATVNIFTFSDCTPSGQYPNIKKFSYHQMELLAEKAGGLHFIKEENWKKVDKLENYLARSSEFEISNKMWLCLEKFASVYIASEGEESEALDEAVFAKLIVPAISAYKASADKFDKSLGETLEAIFGEGNVDSCLKMIKYCDRT